MKVDHTRPPLLPKSRGAPLANHHQLIASTCVLVPAILGILRQALEVA